MIEAEIGGYTFIIFAVLLAMFYAFTYFFVPETKGKSINEITALFTKNSADEKESLKSEFSLDTDRGKLNTAFSEKF